MTQLAATSPPLGASVDIPMPLGGVYEAERYHDQPPGTLVDALNMASLDPSNGRETLSQRCGISKFNTNRINGANAIQELVSTVITDGRVTYTVSNPPTSVWSKSLPGGRSGVAVAVDGASNVYVLATQASGAAGINFLCKLNPAGVLLWAFPVPLTDATNLVKSVKLDSAGNIYVAIAGAGANGQVFKYRQTGVGVEQQWVLNAPNGGLFPDIAVGDNYMYALENTGAPASRLHRYDSTNTGNPSLIWSLVLTYSACVATDLAVDGSCYVAKPEIGGAGTTGAILKIGPQGAEVWNSNTVLGANSDGIGFCVKADASGNVFSIGNRGGNSANICKLADAGTTCTKTWETAASDPNFQGAHLLDLDAQGNLYAALYNTGGGVKDVYKFDGAAGTLVWSYALAAEAYGVACDPVQCDQDSKAEFLYVVGDPASGNSVHKLRLAAASTTDGSHRSLTQVAVSNGTIARFVRGSGAATVPTGGSSALSATARWVQGVTLFNRVLFVDGQTAKSYDLLTDAVSDWAATDAGEVPRRMRLLEFWGGRAVGSGVEDDPHNWFMSEIGDPDHHDYFPPVVSDITAVCGNTAPQAGLCPDVVNSLLAYTDDLLIMGCDHTLFRLTGNPMAGGRFDLVSDITGVAFGRTMCKDENGVIYFFGSRGGVYQLTPGTQPVVISKGIERRLQNIDVGANKIRLAWNDQDKCLYVFVTPYAGGSTTHYIWNRARNAWHPAQLASTSFDPTAVCISDGDSPSDRVLLIGGSDGYVRQIDRAAVDDDGTAISSYGVIGPIRDPSGSLEVKATDLRAVLRQGSSTSDYAVYAAESSDWNIAASVFTGTWAAGRNDAVRNRARGGALWVKYGRFSSGGTGRTALEKLSMAVVPAGRQRNR